MADPGVQRVQNCRPDVRVTAVKPDHSAAVCAAAVCGHLATDIVRASNIGSTVTVITSSVVTPDHCTDCTQGFDSAISE